MVNFRPKCCYICSRFSQQAAAGDDRKYSKPFFVVMVALIAGSGIMKGLLFYMINEVYTQSHSLLHNTKIFFFLSPPMQQQSAKCLAVKISFIIFLWVSHFWNFSTHESLLHEVSTKEALREKGAKKREKKFWWWPSSVTITITVLFFGSNRIGNGRIG